MNRKLKWVSALIIVFLLAIDVLQVVNLFTNYREQKKLYERLLTNSLGDATSMYQHFYLQKSGKKQATFYIVSGDSLTYSINQGTFLSRLNFWGGFELDSIEGGLGYSQLKQMQIRHSFDLHVFDSLFKIELLRNGIDAPYLLDTIKMSIEKPRNAGRSDSLVPTRAQYASPASNDYPVRTASMLVNTYGDMVVYASFKPYQKYILKNLLWVIIASLLLFIITNFALIYVIRTIRQQKRISEIKNDFISNMTHELRTPITVATSAIDAILHHHGLNDPEKVRRYLQTSKEGLLHLDQLVEKILNLSVEERTEIELHFEEINLKEMLHTIVQNHQMITEKKVIIDVVENKTTDTIRADKLHLSNAINNLIDNAIKYSGEPAEVEIGWKIKDQKLSIRVKDKGMGIAKTYHQEIFKSFFRVPHGNIHDVKGFGLGLSYVKKVAEQHNGSIEVESIPGEGSTFILTIPIDPQNG